MSEPDCTTCRRRLTARAVGTISKQAGLSIPGSEVSNQGSGMIAADVGDLENQCLRGREQASVTALLITDT
jgi:hypothetical protein